MPAEAIRNTPITTEINWEELVEDLHKKRCILFLGPSLPVYTNNEEKYDFYSRAARDMSGYLIQHDDKYDPSQTLNIHYTAQKYLLSKNKNRVRLEDKIVDTFMAELKRIETSDTGGLPSIYRNIASLPWHTIVNTQPDNLLRKAFRYGTRFGYYHYRNNKITVSDLREDHLVIYNLFGCLTREEDSEYKVDSLILTEEDQIDFVKNIVAERPAVPDCIISRFKDERKRYIFLDFNLENWHFRLLLDALNLRKSPTISPQHSVVRFSPATREFYENKYGFVFVENNSETFIAELLRLYNETYPKEDKLSIALKHKILYIASDDVDDEIARELIKQLQPWVQRKCLTIWHERISPVGGDETKELCEKADHTILLTSADSFNDPFYSECMQPALERAKHSNDPAKVIAVIARSCAYEETDIDKLQLILPFDGKPIEPRNNKDEIYQNTAQEIADILWPR